jgi:hypothetical protein
MNTLFTTVEAPVASGNMLGGAPQSAHLQVTLTYQSCYNLEGIQQFQQRYESSSYLEP